MRGLCAGRSLRAQKSRLTDHSDRERHMARAILAAIVLFAVASYASAAPVVINVDMTGEKEPNGSGGLNAGSLGSHATGTVTLNPDNDTISWLLNTTAIQGTSFTGFHIHGPVPTPATLLTNVGVYRGFPTPAGNPGTPMTLSGSIDPIS